MTTNTPRRNKGLEKALAAKRKKKAQEEAEWAVKIDKVINDPRMQVYSGGLSPDARRETPKKLLYIQDQLQNNRTNKSQSEIADFENMREKIMRDPFNTMGHLY